MAKNELATTGLTPMDLAKQAMTDKSMEPAQLPAVLRELMALDREYKADRAREAFAKAVAAFQAECPAVYKAKVVTLKSGGAYGFAPIEDVMAVARPIMAKHGLSVSFDVKAGEGNVFVATCHVQHGTHVESHSIPVVVPKEMNVNDTQKMGAMLTYARRYAVCAALNIVVTGEDTDANYTHPAPDTITKEQEAELADLIQWSGSDKAKFLKYCKVANLSQVPASKFEAVKAALVQKGKATGAEA